MKTLFNSVVVLALFFAFSMAYSQDSLQYVWAKQIGGTSYDKFKSMVIDNENCIYSAYISSSSIFSYDDQSFENQNLFLTKIDSNGNLLWAFTTSFIDLVDIKKIELVENGIVAVGYFKGELHIGDTSLYNGDDFPMPFLLKLSSEGDFEWAKVINDISEKISIMDIATDNSNNLYLTGVNLGPTLTINGEEMITPNEKALTVLKYNSLGEILWGTMAGTENGYSKARAIAVDNDNNILIGGNYYGTNFTYQGDTIFNDFNKYLIFLKLDNEGNKLWVKLPISETEGVAFDIATNSVNDIFVTGKIQGESAFDNYTFSNSNTQAFFVAINPDGSYKWVKATEDAALYGLPGEAEGYHIFVSTDYEIYFTGRYSSKVYFENLSLNTNIYFTYYHVFISKMNQNGDFNWVQSIYNNDGNFFSPYRATVVDNNHNLYTSGIFNEFGVYGDEVFYDYGNNDIYLVKLHEDLTGITDNTVNYSIKIFPNPADHQFTINSNFPIENIKLYNQLGEKSLSVKLSSSAGIINTSLLPSGIYFYIIRDKKGHKYTGKWIKK